MVIKLDFEYTRNLYYFHKHSNEDEVDANTFLSRFDNGFPQKWLDVGAGPGRKLIKILKGGKNIAHTTLDLIEPSSDWVRVLKESFQKAGLENHIRQIFECKWEEWIQEHKQKYDLITFFHSIYGIKLDSLGCIPEYLSKDGTACIVSEGIKSDLYKIKKRIHPYFPLSQVFTDQFEKMLIASRIKFSTDETTEQKFYVDDLLDETNPERIVPLFFLLQTKPEDYNLNVPNNVKKMLENILTGLVKYDEHKRAYLSVPDRFFWIQNNP